MRNIFSRVGTCLAISLSASVWAQVGTSQSDQAQQYLLQGGTGQMSPSATAGGAGAPVIPSLQDLRSSLTTIARIPIAAGTSSQ